MKNTLLSALKAAGEIQLKKFNKQIKSSEKESISSVVTEVDLECENEIIKIIQKKYPDHSIVTEETGNLKNNSEYIWIVDPLDGTSNYAAGIPWFGVLVAIINKNEVIMSGAYIPAINKLYYAEKGNGSFCNNKPIKVNKELKLRDSLFAFSTDYTNDENYLNKGISIYKFLVQNCRNVRTTNSLVDLMYVAESKLGGCINLFNRVWDIAAPYLIITEAGGVVFDLNGKDIDFIIDENIVNKNYAIITGMPDIIKELRFINKL